jgi:hypothetical protein
MPNLSKYTILLILICTFFVQFNQVQAQQKTETGLHETRKKTETPITPKIKETLAQKIIEPPSAENKKGNYINWTAIASIATLFAVIVALIPHYKDLFLRRKRRRIATSKLRLIIEDLMFLVDTADNFKLKFISKFYAEIDTIATHTHYELPYKYHEKLLHLLFLLRIYDDSEEAYKELNNYVTTIHKFFAQKDDSRSSKW